MFPRHLRPFSSLSRFFSSFSTLDLDIELQLNKDKKWNFRPEFLLERRFSSYFKTFDNSAINLYARTGKELDPTPFNIADKLMALSFTEEWKETYIKFLKAICSNDSNFLSHVCEHSYYKRLFDFLQKVNSSRLELSLFKPEKEIFKIILLEKTKVQGVFIERFLNLSKESYVKSDEVLYKAVKNSKTWQPDLKLQKYILDSDLASFSSIDDLKAKIDKARSQNRVVQILLEVQSNIKININSRNNGALVYGSRCDELLEKRIVQVEKSKGNWIITDVDLKMGRNPFVK